MVKQMKFLPVNKEDMKKRGLEQLDFIYISGDAYVDHPSFGHAILTRLLESEGHAVGIIAQPDWKNNEDFKKLGTPKYGFLVGSGVVDSMVNHYTAAKKRRSKDIYTPGGRNDKRPDRAVVVYCNKLREIYGKDMPIIIGGLEASLRRFSHYDYWDNRVRNPILIDSQADILSFGMGELAISEIAYRLSQGENIRTITNVRGTSVVLDKVPRNRENYIKINSHEEVQKDKKAYAKSFKVQYEENDSVRGKGIIQPVANKYIVQNPPSPLMTVKEMDRVYALNYTREYHPMYEKDGGIRAIDEVEFSVNSHRGCFGSCSFCAITYHQGRIIQKRSQASIINEVKNMTWAPKFKGYVHDVGGPTANFRNPACELQKKQGACKNKQCLFPEPCKNLKVDHSEYLELLKKLRSIPKVKKVFIRSGIRFDYIVYDNNRSFLNELCEHHISGQLKVAPEHTSSRVLNYMGKPRNSVYKSFVHKFQKKNEILNKKQFLVPYLISGHPGSTMEDAIELAEYLRDIKYSPEQVQDFYPTPGTISTTMYYTGIDPRTMKPVYIPNDEEKILQRALLQFRKKENYYTVLKALKKANREDLIGFTGKCLVKPEKPQYKKIEDRKRQGNKQRTDNRNKPKNTRDTRKPNSNSKKKADNRNSNKSRPRKKK